MPGQQFVNAALFLGCVAAGIALVAGVQDEWLLWALVGGAALFGVLFVLPIGGADMPVVISLLNAFTGLAAAATGFELENNVLIVSGMLVGASGTLADDDDGPRDEPLDHERPLRRVRPGDGGRRPRSRPATAATCAARRAEDVAVMLAYAHKVVFVPGYGLAVAQAQHDVRAARRPARGEGRRGLVRDPSRRGPHARAHERAARRGERAVSRS